MSSLQKRATVGMVISMVCLVVGIALLCSGHDSLDHAFNKGIAEIEKNGEDYLAIKIVAGSLPLIGGGALAVLGFFLLIIFLSVRIKNPLPGSMLTLRGWKGPDQVSASDRAQAKAWQAIQWGYFASQTWILPFFFGSYHALLRPTSFTNQILLLLIVVCSVFYALGIRLCRRRDPASVAAAPRTWKVALAFNYGGLLGFVGSVGTLFFMRFRA